MKPDIFEFIDHLRTEQYVLQFLRVQIVEAAQAIHQFLSKRQKSSLYFHGIANHLECFKNPD